MRDVNTHPHLTLMSGAHFTVRQTFSSPFHFFSLNLSVLSPRWKASKMKDSNIYRWCGLFLCLCTQPGLYLHIRGYGSARCRFSKKCMSALSFLFFFVRVCAGCVVCSLSWKWNGWLKQVSEPGACRFSSVWMSWHVLNWAAMNKIKKKKKPFSFWALRVGLYECRGLFLVDVR